MATKPPSAIANLLSPLSQITEIDFPEYTGFLCEVHEKADTEAYGFPIYPLDKNGKEDDTQARIFPGKVGGTPNKALLGRKRKKPSTAPGAPVAPETITWKEYRTRRHQSAGRISWWGPKMREGNDRKWVLTYAGPNTRHFPDGFKYGTTKDHNEIYCNGGIVAVAPFPVTGAALIKIPDDVKANANGKLEPYTFYIVCVCIDDEDHERVYRTLFKPPVFAKDMTDEIRKAMKSELNYDSSNPYDGWLLLCTIKIRVGDDKYRKASTPFFFSEDGTKACAIRLKDFKFVADASDGIEVTEIVGSKISVTIPANATSGSFTNDKNDPPYEWKESGEFTDYGVFGIGGEAAQNEKGFAVLGIMSGVQIVAVDYVENELIECRYRVEGHRGFAYDWVKAVKWPLTTPWPGGYSAKYVGKMPYANSYLPTPVVDDDLMQGMEYPNHPANHQYGLWLKDSVFNTLEWTVKGKKKVAVIELSKVISSTSTTNNFITETVAARMYVRHLDLRAPVIFAHISEEHLEYSDGGATVDSTEAFERESWCKDFSNPKETTYTHIASSEPFDAEGIGIPPEAPISTSLSANWTKVEELWAGSDYWEWKAKTYRGVPPDTNDDDSKGKINSKSKYNTANKSLIANSWIGLDQLEDPAYQTEDMSVAVLPSLEILANMYLYDVELDDGTYTLYTVESKPMDAESTMGGPRLYPITTI